jgi:hypothetical protein
LGPEVWILDQAARDVVLEGVERVGGALAFPDNSFPGEIRTYGFAVTPVRRAISLMLIPFPFNAWISTSSLRVIMEVRAFLEN